MATHSEQESSGSQKQVRSTAPAAEPSLSFSEGVVSPPNSLCSAMAMLYHVLSETVKIRRSVEMYEG